MSVTRLPDEPCPACGHPLSAVGTIDGSDQAPEPGDPTLCIYCGVYLAVGPPLRLLSNAEWFALPPESRQELSDARAYFQQHPPRRPQEQEP